MKKSVQFEILRPSSPAAMERRGITVRVERLDRL